jgi:hypothetical protein
MLVAPSAWGLHNLAVTVGSRTSCRYADQPLCGTTAMRLSTDLGERATGTTKASRLGPGDGNRMSRLLPKGRAACIGGYRCDLWSRRYWNVRPWSGKRLSRRGLAKPRASLRLMPGFIALELQRCIEAPSRQYLLLKSGGLRSRTIRSASRTSPEYQRWKRSPASFLRSVSDGRNHYEKVYAA